MGGIQFGIYTLPDTIAEINNLVTQISTGLIDLEGELSAKIAAIKPAVKSVQRGVVAPPLTESFVDVSISPVDMTKSFAIVEWSYMQIDCKKTRPGNYAAAVVLIDNTTVRIATSQADPNDTTFFGWQVFEYN